MARVLFVLLAVLAVVSANRFNPINAFRNNTNAVCGDQCQNGVWESIGMNKVMPIKEAEWEYCRKSKKCPGERKDITNGVEKCKMGVVDVHQNEDGSGDYACDKVDLMSYVSHEALGSKKRGNDIWGATLYFGDDEKDVAYLAIMCHTDGTSFVDITDSKDPVVLGFLPTYDCGEASSYVCSYNRNWRDIKVYGDRAFIVSEQYGHGMQVLNMKELYSEERTKGHLRVRDRVPGQGPQTLEADYHYNQFGQAHNIALNEETGYAYVIGTRTCSGGLHIIDVAKEEPEFVGCFADDGYTHDCQCLTYKKSYPDHRYHGHEICFNFNEDTLTIVDVTDKTNMKMIARETYKGEEYTHQGWLSEDGRFLLLDDELDEIRGSTVMDPKDNHMQGARTRTLIWDLGDLEHPQWLSSFISTETVIDHNLYIYNKKAYQSNYCGGLRILDVSNPLSISEYGFFDIAPYCAGPTFQGSWSNFPYYENHPDNKGNDNNAKYQIVAVSSIERGLYMLRLDLD